MPAERPVTVEPGDHRKAIALLPVSALRLDGPTVDDPRMLGFERIEQLIGASRAPLAKRFGRGLHRRLDQALGNVPEPIEPVFPEHLPRAGRGRHGADRHARGLRAHHRRSGRRRRDQLVRTGKGARRLDCRFHRVDGHVQAIRVGTATPSRDSAHLAKLLRAKVETVEPGLGIEAATLVVPLV